MRAAIEAEANANACEEVERRIVGGWEGMRGDGQEQYSKD